MIFDGRGLANRNCAKLPKMVEQQEFDAETLFHTLMSLGGDEVEVVLPSRRRVLVGAYYGMWDEFFKIDDIKRTIKSVHKAAREGNIDAAIALMGEDNHPRWPLNFSALSMFANWVDTKIGDPYIYYFIVVPSGPGYPAQKIRGPNELRVYSDKETVSVFDWLYRSTGFVALTGVLPWCIWEQLL